MKEYESTETILWKELIKGSFSYKGAEYYKRCNHDTFKKKPRKKVWFAPYTEIDIKCMIEQ